MRLTIYVIDKLIQKFRSFDDVYNFYMISPKYIQKIILDNDLYKKYYEYLKNRTNEGRLRLNIFLIKNNKYGEISFEELYRQIYNMCLQRYRNRGISLRCDDAYTNYPNYSNYSNSDIIGENFFESVNENDLIDLFNEIYLEFYPYTEFQKNIIKDIFMYPRRTMKNKNRFHIDLQ